MHNLTPITLENKRVLLTSQIAELYGTDSKVISNNFNRNSTRYHEGKDYYCLEDEAKRDFVNLHQIEDGSKKAKTLYLWTEHGALLHAKSLGTDRAWEIYSELVDTYFRVQEQTSISEYKPKMTSLGEVANYIKLVSKFMEKQGSTAEQIVQMIDNINKQFGIELPTLAKHNPWEQMTLTVTTTQMTLN